MIERWVRDNIRYFGGNPDSVTIFGQSAGGASVEFQMLSPHSKGIYITFNFPAFVRNIFKIAFFDIFPC